jgi:Mrp family chromosome partitioning ATPase
MMEVKPIQVPTTSAGAIYSLQAPLTPAGVMMPTMAIGAGAGASDGAPPAIAVNKDIYSLALEIIRGHLLLISVLCGIGAAAGAYVGWRQGAVVYRSEGLLRIAYSKDPIATETDQNGPIRMYEALLRSEMLKIQSRPTIQAALKTHVWQQGGYGGDSDEVLKAFATNLSVERPPGTELLRVCFTDSRPAVAAAAVRGVIQAYSGDFRAKEVERDENRDRVLEELQQRLSKRLAGLDGRIREIEVAGLEQAHTIASQRVAGYQAKLDDIQVGLALAQGRGPEGAVKVMTVMQMAQLYPAVGDALAKKRGLEEELSRLSDSGFKDGHPSVVRVKSALSRAVADLDRLAEEYRSQPVVGPASEALSDKFRGQFARPVKELETEQAVLTKLMDLAKEELKGLTNRRLELESLKHESKRVQEELAQHTDRRQKLLVERNAGSRLDVLSEGDTPMSPFHDTRPKFGAVGMVLIGGIPLGIVVLFGLSRPRYRFSGEAANQDLTRTLPLLGVIPELPKRVADQNQAADAAQCVHRIRVMLGALKARRSGGGGGAMYLISSASPGEGKTSVALALALSHALSGERTLLIDADLTGRRVTRGFDAEGKPGLREALESGTLEVRRSLGGLAVLTAGVSDPMDGCRTSSPAMRRLLDQARRHFDTVLIDTGPMLGSVEASALAREVDGVVFVIARGQRPYLVQRAMEEMRMVGGEVAGLIFNRAMSKDFYRSFQSSSLRSDEMEAELRARFVRPENPSQFGPLVQAVASFMPAVTQD